MMWYGLISVTIFPHYTVTYVTNICVKTVRKNIALIRPQNTKWCHLYFGDVSLNVIFFLKYAINSDNLDNLNLGYKDNLFVAERSGRVKKIKYCKKYAINSVNSVTFLFVYSVLHLENTAWTWWENFNAK